MIAAQGGNAEAVFVLLSAGADVYASDNSGSSALEYAPERSIASSMIDEAISALTQMAKK